MVPALDLNIHLAQGMLQQCRRALKPDGLFLAAMLGGDTLHELRVSCNLAEEELQGGVSQRVSPLAQVKEHSTKLLHQICFVVLQQASIHCCAGLTLVSECACMASKTVNSVYVLS